MAGKTTATSAKSKRYWSRSTSPRLLQAARHGWRAAPRPQPSRGSGFAPIDAFTSRNLLVAGVALIIAGYFVGVDFMIWIGLGCFVAAYIVFFMKPRSPIEKRWRGQSIEDPRPESALSRIWRRLNRK